MAPPSIVKFKVEFVAHDVPHDARVDELRRWCERFNELGLTPMLAGAGRSLGNLSFRLRRREPAFVITGSTLSTKGALAPGDFVTVLHADRQRRTVQAVGTRDPSSESMMHFAIYEARPDVEAIFHGHDRALTAHAALLGVPETEQEEPSGTPELMEQVMRILGQQPFVVMRNHGFLSLGHSMDDAGRRALELKNTLTERMHR
jgi:ribulose-5-phosphate 4-epimerase/fuculose-1-phosphate aldolase